MPPKSDNDPKVVARWIPEEEAALVNFLHQHRAEASDGTGNFKLQTYNQLAAAIAPFRKPGTPAKTTLQCKNKWKALRHVYSEIERYRNTSGFHWDNVGGAGIVGADAQRVWEGYTQIHKVLRPYRNEGWPFYDLMQEIMPNGVATGHHAFDASVATPTTPATPPASSSMSSTQLEGNISTELQQVPSSLNSTNLTSQTLFTPGNIASGGIATGNTVTTSTTNMQSPPPHSNASSRGKRPHTEMSDHDSVMASNFLELPYAQTISSANAGPSSKKRKGGNTAASVVGMTMPDAMVVAATPRNSRSQVAPPVEPPNPLLVSLVGAMNHLAGSVDRTMQPPEERVSTKKQQAIRILEEEHGDLPIEHRILLLHLIGENDYIADVLAVVNKEHRLAYITDLLQKHGASASHSGT
ncbi:hypothetical protein EDD15DRAFT_2439411 [Pisolithus albus]|nr:hypothetical protein EDD15DRAFT_2439411 [Pisolithus albus]